MIGKLIPKSWTTPAGRELRPEDVDKALDRLEELERTVKGLEELVMASLQSPAYHD